MYFWIGSLTAGFLIVLVFYHIFRPRTHKEIGEQLERDLKRLEKRLGRRK